MSSEKDGDGLYWRAILFALGGALVGAPVEAMLAAASSN